MKDVSILTPETPQYKGGILTIKVEGHDFNQLRLILLTEYKCQVRAIYENNINGLRISTSIYNTKKEIDTLVEALETITL